MGWSMLPSPSASSLLVGPRVVPLREDPVQISEGTSFGCLDPSTRLTMCGQIMRTLDWFLSHLPCASPRHGREGCDASP